MLMTVNLFTPGNQEPNVMLMSVNLLYTKESGGSRDVRPVRIWAPWIKKKYNFYIFSYVLLLLLPNIKHSVDKDEMFYILGNLNVRLLPYIYLRALITNCNLLLLYITVMKHPRTQLEMTWLCRKSLNYRSSLPLPYLQNT